MTMILLWAGDWPIANPAEYVREGIDHAGVNEPLREYEPSIAAGLTALIRGTREPEKGDD